MTNSYLPVGDMNIANWYANFSSKMNSIYGFGLDFTPAELSSIQNDSTALSNSVLNKENLRQSALATTAYVRMLMRSSQQTTIGQMPVAPSLLPMPANMLNGILNRLAIYVNRIKHHAGYTTAMGQDLGIIAPPDTFDPATAKPGLTIRLSGGYPVVKWKRGKADGVYLYADRRDGNGFVLINKFIRTEYVDIEPLPPNTFSVNWDYKARYMIDDDEIGLFSDVVTINVIRV